MPGNRIIILAKHGRLSLLQDALLLLLIVFSVHSLITPLLLTHFLIYKRFILRDRNKYNTIQYNLHDFGKTANTKQVIEATLELIQHFSIPEVLYSDGGPQFVKDGELDYFCEEWGIRHICSSPYMPRSNGVAESGVKEMKKLIRANLSSSGILNKASAISGIQMFRNTPRTTTGESPAQLIFGRDIRDSLPCNRQHLLPGREKIVRPRTEKAT